VKSLRRFLSDERGLETVEHDFLAGILLLGDLVALAALDQSLARSTSS